MVSINNLSISLNLSHAFYLAAALFIIMGFVIEILSPLGTSKQLIMIFSGIAIASGVFIDVTLDFYLRHIDRNLFPFEILMWYIFAPIPLIIGIEVSRVLRKL